mgnify:CR=1 FL=1
MGNCWISCQVMADMKKVYDDLIINKVTRNSIISLTLGFMYVWSMDTLPAGGTLMASPLLRNLWLSIRRLFRSKSVFGVLLCAKMVSKTLLSIDLDKALRMQNVIQAGEFNIQQRP